MRAGGCLVGSYPPDLPTVTVRPSRAYSLRGRFEMIKRIVGLALLVAALGAPVMAYAATAESCPSGCPSCPCPGC